MKTKFTHTNEVQRKCYIVDATDQVLGRLAVRVADTLRGKNKAIYTPNVDAGDMVIITNAAKVRVTGNKSFQKEYQRYSGYPSGQKALSFNDMMEKSPEKVIELAIKRMLPKNRLSNKIFTKLFVYSGSDHPHGAQQPEPLEV